MKNNKIPILVIMLLITLVAIAGIITMMVRRGIPSKERVTSEEYFGPVAEGEAAIVVDGAVIDARAKKSGEKIYIDYQTVTEQINNRFYWDQDEGLLIYTLPKQVLQMNLSDDMVRQEVQAEGDTLYLSTDLIQDYTDMTLEIQSDPARVAFSDAGCTITEMKVSADTQIRSGSSIKDPIVADAAVGDTVRVFSDESGWSEILTQDGWRGYIQDTETGKPTEATIASVLPADFTDFTSIQESGRINLVWQHTRTAATNKLMPEMMAQATGITVIAPTWYSVKDNNGSLFDDASDIYVQTAHGMGIKVWGVINNMPEEAEIDTQKILSSTSTRGWVISQLIDSATRVGLDGINLDFEDIGQDTSPHFIQFVRELSVACRNAGLSFSIDDPVPLYTAYYNRAEQSAWADYIIIMAYDEHYAGSETAGSVSSYPFVKQAVEDTLAEVPAEKTVLGIPFYTRRWTTASDGTVSSEVLGMTNAEEYITQTDMQVAWDDELKQNYAKADTTSGTDEIWLEDAQSISAKLQLVQDKDLAGVAAWRLGFEDSSIWATISQYLQ